MTRKKPLPFAKERLIARRVAERFGGEIEDVTHAHQIMKYRAPGVVLVFYPHKTTARHYHVRIRDEHSKDKEAAQNMLAIFSASAGFSCTFTHKFEGLGSWQVLAKAGLEPGWAAS